MTAPKKPKKTQDQLEREIFELRSQLIHVYHAADSYLQMLKPGALVGSGVILQLSMLGGKEVFPPVMIKNGLSQDTVEAIRRDLVRSYKDTAEFKPKGA